MVHPRRYVHESKYDAVVTELAKLAANSKVIHPCLLIATAVF